MDVQLLQPRSKMFLSFVFTLVLYSCISFVSFPSGGEILKCAGGLAFNQLPLDCNVNNPLACTGSPCAEVQTAQNVQALNSTIQSAQIYAYHLPQNDQPVTDNNPQWLFERCLSQCYGYGSSGECVAVYQSYNFLTPAMMGSFGGSMSVACLMFNRALTVKRFPSGQQPSNVHECFCRRYQLRTRRRSSRSDLFVFAKFPGRWSARFTCDSSASTSDHL